MRVEVVGFGLGPNGWTEAVRYPVTAATPFKGITAQVCEAVHALGFCGAEVRLERRCPNGKGLTLDAGRCVCERCRETSGKSPAATVAHPAPEGLSVRPLEGVAGAGQRAAGARPVPALSIRRGANIPTGAERASGES